MLQREQIMRGKEHWPPKCVVRQPFSLLTCLATTQQRLVKSPRDPGVVSLHVNAGHFATPARWVTSPTWGPPPPCKQALKQFSCLWKYYRSENTVQSWFFEMKLTLSGRCQVVTEFLLSRHMQKFGSQKVLIKIFLHSKTQIDGKLWSAISVLYFKSSGR